MKYIPHAYQDHATRHIVEHSASGLFLEMGLGKTVSTLTAIDQLLNDLFEVRKVLVIAPKRVAEDTWSTEVEKWDHLCHLKISKILGDAKKRAAALREKADIWVINRENVVWLVSHLAGNWPFDMVVIDELSSFKSAKAARFKALRMVRPKINRVVGLTGTPAPNGLLDLWPQLYLLDMGERLGKTLTSYREKYFTEGKRNGHIVYEYKMRQEDSLLGKGYYEKEIYEKIGDICISMKAKDYLQLPERLDVEVPVNLGDETLERYHRFEEEEVLKMYPQPPEGGYTNEIEISAPNAAALTTKLLQFANGAIYDENGKYHELHDAKLDALDEILDVAQQPVLVFYSYKHDLERILLKFKSYKPRQLKSSADIKDWNDGKISLLLAHPASAGHGLNLQAGGNVIVWFGLPWSLELFQQACARLHRQGQTKNVIIHLLMALGTMDADVLKALMNKTQTQDALMDAVKARIGKYLKLAA